MTSGHGLPSSSKGTLERLRGRPGLTPPTARVRRQMQAQKTTGTKIELQVRRELHARGFRYRVDRKLLPEQPFRGDIVWSGRRVVVFLDGCFWHGCPLHGTSPKSNREWWKLKIQGNRDRDLRVDAILRERGWTVLRYWEHDDPVTIVEAVVRQLTGLTEQAKNQLNPSPRESSGC